MADPASRTCVDVYLFNSLHAIDLDYFALSHSSTTTLTNLTSEDMDWIEWKGIRCFLFKDGVLKTLTDLLNLAEAIEDILIPNPGDQYVSQQEQQRNWEFLKKYTNHAIEKRSDPHTFTLNETQLHTGDVLAVMRLDIDDTMIMTGTGGRAGHVCVLFWRNDTLWVLEDGEGPNPGHTIAAQKSKWTTWRDWRESVQFNAVHLPLSPASRAKFDEEAAWAFFEKNENGPYGFPTLGPITLDTPSDSFPDFFRPETMEAVAALMQRFKPETCQLFLAMTLNHRIGTKNLTALECIYQGWRDHKMSTGDIIAIPEKEEWRYQSPDLASYGCSSFVSALLRAGGLYDDVDISPMEQSPRDIYMLDIFDHDYVLPPLCKKLDPDMKHCQLFGSWRMELEWYNTIKPYDRMNDHCPLVPPDFKRPSKC